MAAGICNAELTKPTVRHDKAFLFGDGSLQRRRGALQVNQVDNATGGIAPPG
eukprot:CAMPEP_0176127314 /NCGR_PEP_ID=MMETSP0120_2-20121206/64295_1 /TAXON_ID=160619 /ORGANISM="Kryptoperidinium foliaceum, Strain CCMP 1326" /LENGTH=51 /DNA_ID=CAMNT_0017462323 /DNA_START=99 /DNA_END=250 /DNA_ORIENTATION=-